jgi:hypothetical protein
VGIDDAAGDGEAEAGAAAVAGAGLPEAVENVRELGLVHAGTGVEHADAQGFIITAVVTRTVPPRGVNFMALPIRLPSA